MFGAEATVAVQDPSYPVYVDGSVILGQTGGYDEGAGQFDGIEYMRCDASNNFFPDLSSLKRTDLIYFCSPNNPTGAVATKEQLKELVEFAKTNQSILIFDAAYSAYIEDPDLPRSIFEIEGSREVALEINSFSKMAGFTGVRLGWTVVPQELQFEDGTPVSKDWNRIVTTLFNGASNIVQRGGVACLSEEGYREVEEMIQYYKTNASIIKKALTEIGLEVYGGVNSPYCWASMKGKGSWEAFEEILTQAFVVTTPGAGFGPAGEGFVRFSSFGHRADVEEAVERLKKHFG
jgi:LL-diaminopimelate aminotransferase